MSWGGIFDVDGLKRRLAEIEAAMARPGFWDTPNNPLIAELKRLKARLQPVDAAVTDLHELSELAGIVEAGDDVSIRHLTDELARVERHLAQLEFQRLLGDERDIKDAILSVHAGAGGTESCDWASMLLRMYQRWAEAQEFSVELIDLLDGEEAGVKNATLLIHGAYAYGYLKAEEGVHRLVRISPFDSNKRRHTSFVSVDVIPAIEDEVPVEINPSDLRVDTYRSSGAGGQHVNKTDSAVRLTHLPTGLVVQCQDERSQIKNRSKAMKVLRSRLAAIEREKREAEQAADYAAKQKIEWGSQIRSYVLHPYLLVKDHRTEHETSNAQAVLDGQLEEFMQAYLKWQAARP